MLCFTRSALFFARSAVERRDAELINSGLLDAPRKDKWDKSAFGHENEPHS